MTATTVRDADVVNTCLRDALNTVGVTVTREAINAVMGIAKPVAVRTLLTQGLGVRPDDAHVRAVHDEFIRRMTVFYRTDPAVQEMPGATQVFHMLKSAGYKIALGTGFSRQIVNVLLERLGWGAPGFLDVTISSDDVSNGRPHPDMVLEAVRRSGVSSVEASAKVGDTPADLQEGMSAGCGLVIGVTNGTHSRSELAMCPHTHLIDSLEELPAVLGLGGNGISSKASSCG